MRRGEGASEIDNPGEHPGQAEEGRCVEGNGPEPVCPPEKGPELWTGDVEPEGLALSDIEEGLYDIGSKEPTRVLRNPTSDPSSKPQHVTVILQADADPVCEEQDVASERDRTTVSRRSAPVLPVDMVIPGDLGRGRERLEVPE